MQHDLNHLISWFPSGTAEGEKTILEHVFVYVDEFANMMAPPPGNPHLLIGPKGSGKSAIMDFGIRLLKQQEVPAIFLTPADIDTSTLGESNSTGDMVRFFSTTLMTAIATKLSETSKSWFESGDNALLYQEAVNTGTRTADFVGRMGRFLAEIAKPLIKVDLNAAFSHLTQVTRDQLGKAIERSLNSRSFYIFIDDTDQIANPDKPGHLNRIWSLMLAVRRLTSSIPELKAVISLRSEVWERLKIDPAGQRDQTDHFSNLCVILRSDRDHVAKIVDRRLALAAVSCGKYGESYGVFFDGDDARAPFSDDRRSWRDLIAVRSRARPRDAIQLVNYLAKRAIADKKQQIDEATFQSVMPGFSEKIAKDFAAEVILECPVALEILRTFGSIQFEDGAFTMKAEQALSHFTMILSKFGVKIHGITLSQSKEGDIFELWRFFYLCGVINARISDTSKRDGYRHLDPESDLTLVSKVRWNEMQKILWEINTVYRDYLIAVGREESLKLGLPLKIVNKRGRNSGRRRK